MLSIISVGAGPGTLLSRVCRCSPSDCRGSLQVLHVLQLLEQSEKKEEFRINLELSIVPGSAPADLCKHEFWNELVLGMHGWRFWSE